MFVEAKTSLANPNNPDLKNREKFEKEISEICEKFIHSLNLYSTIKVGVGEQELTSAFDFPEKNCQFL
jgi:hypothetical protein